MSDEAEKRARQATDDIESACQADRLVWSLGSGKAKDVADRIFAAHLRTYGDTRAREAEADMRQRAAGAAWDLGAKYSGPVCADEIEEAILALPLKEPAPDAR